MSGKYSFTLKTGDRRRSLPHKLILGCQETETARHVLLKLLAFLFFHRERLQIEPRLHDDNLPFRPDLVELDYQLRPCLWVECGECSVQKLDKLAVKAPEAELWILRGSVGEVQDLMADMRKARLRQNRYHLLGLDHEPFEEILSRLVTRNEVFWVDGRLDPPLIQLDFNGFWFELDLHLFRF